MVRNDSFVKPLWTQRFLHISEQFITFLISNNTTQERIPAPFGILEKHASRSVIFQSKKATIRWPGSESGMLAYPAWNSLPSAVLKTGVATQYDDDPKGDAWAPLEADAPLYNHNWFWSTANEKKRKSLKDLMEMYYKSAGYGG